MPTGYTSEVHDGKTVTLANYLRTCVRAFILDMREEPIDAPIPDRSTYKDDVVAGYEAKVKAALDTIYEIEGLTDAECGARALVEHEERVAQATRWNNEKLVVEARYRGLLDQIDAWDTPHRLRGVRDFMREQLESSIKWDCTPHDMPAAPTSAADWRTEQVEHAREMHRRWSADLAKQREGQSNNNAFMETLHAELRRLDESQTGNRPPQDHSDLSTDTGEQTT